ncbi:MAG: hypothetical protein HFF03_04815 [Oscillospiraceae bacterium]|jgi:hypothetical protein|nr:hypothetical protein [Oscillospiraceae bacterium]
MTDLENRPHKEEPWETPEKRRTPPPGGRPAGSSKGPGTPSGGPSAEGAANYVVGALGAFLGAVVGALPTLLTGLFGFVSGWLALLIPFGARKGYQMFHGPRKTGFAFALILVLSALTAVGVCCWLIWPYSPLEAGLGFFLIPIIFSVIGSFGCRQSLKLYTEPGLMEALTRRVREDNGEERAQQAAFYPCDKRWTTPLRVSMMLSMFPELGIMLALLLYAVPNESMAWTMASLGACIGLFAVMFVMIFPLMSQLQGLQYLFFRTADGRLWRVMLARFNTMDTYRFSRKNAFWTGMTWEKLDEGERELFRASALRAAEDLAGGRIFPGSLLSRVVIPMEDVTLRKETRWCWKVSYRDGAGKTRRMTIPKTYPGFTPVEGDQAPQGPMPYRWGMVVIALAVTFAFALGGWAMGRRWDDPAPSRRQEVAAVRIPESSTAYEHDGVRYQVDSRYESTDEGFYIDGTGKDDIRLMVTVYHGMDMRGAWDLLTGGSTADARKALGSYLEWDGGEGVLVPLAEGGQGCYYNMLSREFSVDNKPYRLYQGIVLAPDGTAVLVASDNVQDRQKKDVKGDILYILQSVEVTLTGDNYQSLFQPAPGYDYMGIAYYRTADGLGFRDAYLPYGGELTYNTDGTVVSAYAHGMTVTQTMATASTAKEVVEADYAALAGEVDLYADGVSETYYLEDYDIAYRQVTWFEENRTRVRVAVLYADTRGEGNYLSARIVYHPEAFDEEYPGLLEELRDVFALDLPQLDPME